MPFVEPRVGPFDAVIFDSRVFDTGALIGSRQFERCDCDTRKRPVIRAQQFK